MNIQNIIYKTELSQDEVQFVIEEYIWDKKKVKVKINVNKNPVLSLVPPIIQQHMLGNEFQLMMEAYNIACGHFIEKFPKESS